LGLQLNARSRLRAAAACIFLQASISHAAQVGDHLNDQTPPRTDYLPSKPTDPFQLPPVELPARQNSPEENAVKFKLDRVLFRGNTVLPQKELDALAAPYVGRVISLSELEDLRLHLTKLYIDRGYVTSGVLLSKESGNGVIVFQVVQGKLSGIRLRGMGRLNDDYVIKRLAKDINAPLDINDLREQFQLLLSDPLFERMNARLVPDANLGEALLDVDVERARPYQFTAAFDNYRPPSIGTEEFTVSGSVRNLTGFGDVLQASIQAPPSLKESGLHESVAWRLPLGYCGTDISFAIEHGLSAVEQESLQALGIGSTLNSRDVGLSQTLIDSLKHKLTVGLDRVIRENTTTLLGSPYSFIQQEPDGVADESLWRFWQEYAYRSAAQVLALRSTFTFGHNNVEPLTGLPPTVTAIPSDYRIWLAQVQYAHRVLDNGAQIVFRYTAQVTRDKLLPLDGISIGGNNTVRGFVENQLVLDRGNIFNLEFEYPVLHDEFKLALIPFYDIGKGQNQGDVATTISAAGLEARGQWRHVSLDISAAKKLSYPDSVTSPGGSLQEKGIYFQLAYNY
jgi:hemolysin activation/secretion protein